MFVAINRMTVPEEYREKFETMFKTRAHAVDQRPGFVSAQILRPSEGNDYLVVTHWESREHFDSWNGSEEYKQGHSRVGEFRGADGKMALRSSVEQYEVIAK